MKWIIEYRFYNLVWLHTNTEGTLMYNYFWLHKHENQCHRLLFQFFVLLVWFCFGELSFFLLFQPHFIQVEQL